MDAHQGYAARPAERNDRIGTAVIGCSQHRFGAGEGSKAALVVGVNTRLRSDVVSAAAEGSISV